MIKPIIRTPKRKDGLYRIHYDISHKGQRLFVDSGVLTTNKLTKQGRVTDVFNCAAKNSKLIHDTADIERILLDNYNVNLSELKDRIHAVVHGQTSGSFIEYVETYVKKCRDGLVKVSPLTIKQYASFANKLKEFRGEIHFDSINKQFYEKFIKHLSDGRSANTIDNAIKHLKMFMRMSLDEGLHSNTEFTKKYFRRCKIQTDHIALTQKELDAIAKVKLPDHLKLERDRFIVGSYLLLRFSDSIKINKTMFTEKEVDGKKVTMFKIKHNKTGTEVMIPVKAEVLQILKARNYNLAGDENQEANWKVKEICRMAKINDTIEINGKRGHKYEFVSTHTARRTGATLLYMACKDLNLVKMIGGWKTLSSLQLYLRVDRIDAADEASKLSFFK
jgi:integrase